VTRDLLRRSQRCQPSELPDSKPPLLTYSVVTGIQLLLEEVVGVESVLGVIEAKAVDEGVTVNDEELCSVNGVLDVSIEDT
jgi:hypothetical protein